MTIFNTFWENFVKVFEAIIAAGLQFCKHILNSFIFYSTTVHVGIFHWIIRFWGEFDVEKVAHFIFHIFQRTLRKILAAWPWEHDDWCIHMSSICLSVCMSVCLSIHLVVAIVEDFESGLTFFISYWFTANIANRIRPCWHKLRTQIMIFSGTSPKDSSFFFWKVVKKHFYLKYLYLRNDKIYNDNNHHYRKKNIFLAINKI